MPKFRNPVAPSPRNGESYGSYQRRLQAFERRTGTTVRFTTRTGQITTSSGVSERLPDQAGNIAVLEGNLRALQPGTRAYYDTQVELERRKVAQREGIPLSAVRDADIQVKQPEYKLLEETYGRTRSGAFIRQGANEGDLSYIRRAKEVARLAENQRAVLFTKINRYQKKDLRAAQQHLATMGAVGAIVRRNDQRAQILAEEADVKAYQEKRTPRAARLAISRASDFRDFVDRVEEKFNIKKTESKSIGRLFNVLDMSGAFIDLSKAAARAPFEAAKVGANAAFALRAIPSLLVNKGTRQETVRELKLATLETPSIFIRGVSQINDPDVFFNDILIVSSLFALKGKTGVKAKEYKSVKYVGKGQKTSSKIMRLVNKAYNKVRNKINPTSKAKIAEMKQSIIEMNLRRMRGKVQNRELSEVRTARHQTAVRSQGRTVYLSSKGLKLFRRAMAKTIQKEDFATVFRRYAKEAKKTVGKQNIEIYKKGKKQPAKFEKSYSIKDGEGNIRKVNFYEYRRYLKALRKANRGIKGKERTFNDLFNLADKNEGIYRVLSRQGMSKALTSKSNPFSKMVASESKQIAKIEEGFREVKTSQGQVLLQKTKQVQKGKLELIEGRQKQYALSLQEQKLVKPLLIKSIFSSKSPLFRPLIIPIFQQKQETILKTQSRLTGVQNLKINQLGSLGYLLNTKNIVKIESSQIPKSVVLQVTKQEQKTKQMSKQSSGLVQSLFTASVAGLLGVSILRFGSENIGKYGRLDSSGKRYGGYGYNYPVNYRREYSADLTSRIFGIRSREKGELLRIGRTFTGLENRPLVF